MVMTRFNGDVRVLWVAPRNQAGFQGFLNRNCPLHQNMARLSRNSAKAFLFVDLNEPENRD